MGPASFRKIPFFVESAEFAGGRRSVKHEFFGKDEQFVEDTGRKGREFQIEGYVLGEDYFTARDALIDELEKAGPGELIHPYHGQRQVVCSSFRVRSSAKDGGIAMFTISFDQTETTPSFPKATLDSKSALKATAVSALSAAKLELLALANVSSLANGALNKLTGMVTGASRQLSSLLGPLASTTQALASLKQSLSDLSANAAGAARAPGDMFDTIAATVGALGAAGDPVTAVRSLLAAYNFDPGSARPATDTLASQVEQTSHDAYARAIARINLIQATIVSLEGVASPDVEGAYRSYEDALATRDSLTGALDEQLELAGDTLFPMLMQLRANLVAAVPGPESDLAHLVEHTLLVTLPSLLVSHQLYGNLDGEADLIARNHIKHPGFVPGAVSLAVLSEV
jgi:prophage DNA circulation protein